jgi:hypothetical protein
MKIPPLFRRRQIWVPTLWSWLILLVAGGVLVTSAGGHLSFFLAPNQPVGAHVLVVEGWMDAIELDGGIEAYRSGGYERVVTTGGPIEGFERIDASQTYAERSRNYLVRHGVPADSVIAVPAPASLQNRSFLNAVMVREWVSQSGLAIDALDVFSSGVHGRRSWLLYAMAFDSPMRIGILSGRPSNYDLDGWWRTSIGTKEVLGETIAWIWTKLFFHPGPRGSQDELWAVPKDGTTH